MVDMPSGKDAGGSPLTEGTIMGSDGERPMGRRDNFMHSKVANLQSNLVEGKSMERHSNMEPYPALFSDDSFIAHSAQVLKEAQIHQSIVLAPEAAELGADALGASSLGDSIGGIMHSVLGIGGGSSGGSVGGGIEGGIGRDIGEMAGKELGIGGGGGGSQQSAPPSQPASVPTISAVTADYESPGSIDSVGLREGDPTRTDQHEFDDGDNTNRPDNPNLEDSGASGEDQVRQNGGFAPDSPALQRAELLQPLLLHYYHSPESGSHEPLIMGLHKTLHDENPNYLDNFDSLNSQIALEKWLQGHKSLGVHAKTAIVQQPGNMFGPQQMGNQMGQCNNCGSATTADGSCPTCGAKTDPTGGVQNGGGGFAPGMGYTAANHQGPVTNEQIAAVQQLLIQQGRISELPDVPLQPQDYAKEMAEIQGNPNLAPQVDPSQIPPPPQPPMGPPGMGGGPPPGADPSQGGGGMPPQMGSVTAADSISRRCPNCHSGTTGLLDDDEGSCYCSACGHTWTDDNIKKHTVSSTRVSDDLQAINPSTQPAAEHGHRDITQEQDSSLTWQDNNGEALQAGKEYEMHNPAYEIPDIVKVVFIHPNEVGLKLVGQFSNEQGDNSPDIKLTQQRAKMDSITFIPTQNEQQDQQPPPTTPGQSQVGPASQTTDEVENSYPSQTAISSVGQYEFDSDVCPKCSSHDIEHRYASETREMHTCYRCEKVWETPIEDYGHQSSIDLSWLNESNGQDDFWAGMDRASQMRASGTSSRNISDIAAKDPRLAEISERLRQNKQNAEEFLRTSGRKHSPAEQRALIDEQGLARNSDLLDLSHTHYETKWDSTGKANGENAPEAHLVFGL
jgi:hypothetical protein